MPATAYTDYTIPLTNSNGGATGTHTIKVEFLNNFKTSNGSCDRNLYLDKVSIRQTSPGARTLRPPAPPGSLTATGGNQQVSLDWADNAESDFNHYEVFRSTIQGGPYTKQSTTNLTTSAFTDNVNVQNGTTYYYVVQAFDNSTNPSGFSAEKSATPTAPPPDLTPPGPPANLTATGGNAQVALNWDDNTEPDFNHYDVFRGTTAGGPYTKQNTANLTASQFTDTTNVTNGTTYFYVVRAYDNNTNESNPSAEKSATPAAPPPDLTPPAAPSAFTATPGNATVALDWANNTEPDFNHYDLFRSTTTGGPYLKQNTTNLTVSQFTDTNVTNGTTYYYVVRAYDNNNNESDPSTERSATPTVPVGPPPAPIVFEGEVMTRVPNDNVAVRVIAEAPASAGNTLGYRSSPSAGTRQYTTTADADLVTLRMRGDVCQGSPRPRSPSTRSRRG